MSRSNTIQSTSNSSFCGRIINPTSLSQKFCRLARRIWTAPLERERDGGCHHGNGALQRHMCCQTLRQWNTRLAWRAFSRILSLLLLFFLRLLLLLPPNTIHRPHPFSSTIKDRYRINLRLEIFLALLYHTSPTRGNLRSPLSPPLSHHRVPVSGRYQHNLIISTLFPHHHQILFTILHHPPPSTGRLSHPLLSPSHYQTKGQVLWLNNSHLRTWPAHHQVLLPIPLRPQPPLPIRQ